MKNKLISMVEYVNSKKDINILEYTILETFKNGAKITNDIFNYAKFLTQPLTLGMFIPCDLEGNVLEEPDQQAKERVLFEGFEPFGSDITHLRNLIDNGILKTIQDLIPYNLTLTKQTLKELELI